MNATVVVQNDGGAFLQNSWSVFANFRMQRVLQKVLIHIGIHCCALRTLYGAMTSDQSCTNTTICLTLLCWRRTFCGHFSPLPAHTFDWDLSSSSKSRIHVSSIVMMCFINVAHQQVLRDAHAICLFLHTQEMQYPPCQYVAFLQNVG